MRTTINIPLDLHQQLTSVARDQRQSLSQTTVALLRRALGQDKRARLDVDPKTGRCLLNVDRPISAEDVRCLEDD